MTAVAVPSAAPLSEQVRHVQVASWKSVWILATGTVLFALLPLLAPRAGDATFAFATESDLFQIPDIHVPGTATAWICAALMALITGFAALRTRVARHVPMWAYLIYVVALLFGFLAWAAAGASGSILVVSLLTGSILLAVPLIYGAMGGVIGERAGVVNIAIEGQLLAAAFCAAIVGSLTNSPYAGVIAGILAGMLVSAVLGLFTIKYAVNQIIVGVVLNVLVAGLTTFLYSLVLVPNAESLNTTTRFQRIPIPGLERIPVLGPVLFNQTIIVYVMVIVVIGVWFMLYRTRWGLRLRAVGEHPKAADTVGINVLATRSRALLAAGAIAGIGGSFYTVASISAFNREMTAGAGFIALAAVIFGKWDPIRAALAGLLFGFATNLQNVLGVVGSPVPSQFMLMLPYVVTILAVAGLVGTSRAPAADGIPYVKE